MTENDLISRVRNGTNCPNCGAPIDSTKCSYCGTTFIDFSCIKTDEPFFLKIKDKYDRTIISKVMLDSALFEMRGDFCYSYGDVMRVFDGLSPSTNIHQQYEMRIMLDFHSINESDIITQIIDPPKSNINDIIERGTNE